MSRLVGRAECTTFLTFTKQLWLSALLKGTSVLTGYQTNTLLLTTPELGFGELDRSAKTCHTVKMLEEHYHDLLFDIRFV